MFRGRGRPGRTARPAAPCRRARRCSRACRAAPTGSPMSCRQSKKQIRSNSPGVPGRGGHLELEPARPPPPRPPARRHVSTDGAWKSNPHERRVRVRRGHRHHRRAVPAPDVGHPAPALSWASTPSSAGIHCGREVGPVSGPEEPLGPAEEARVVVAPAQRPVAAERLGDLLGMSQEHRGERVHRPGRRRPASRHRRGPARPRGRARRCPRPAS